MKEFKEVLFGKWVEAHLKEESREGIVFNDIAAYLKHVEEFDEAKNKKRLKGSINRSGSYLKSLVRILVTLVSSVLLTAGLSYSLRGVLLKQDPEAIYQSTKLVMIITASAVGLISAIELIRVFFKRIEKRMIITGSLLKTVDILGKEIPYYDIYKKDRINYKRGQSLFKLLEAIDEEEAKALKEMITSEIVVVRHTIYEEGYSFIFTLNGEEYVIRKEEGRVCKDDAGNSYMPDEVIKFYEVFGIDGAWAQLYKLITEKEGN